VGRGVYGLLEFLAESLFGERREREVVLLRRAELGRGLAVDVVRADAPQNMAVRSEFDLAGSAVLQIRVDLRVGPIALRERLRRLLPAVSFGETNRVTSPTCSGSADCAGGLLTSRRRSGAPASWYVKCPR